MKKILSTLIILFLIGKLSAQVVKVIEIDSTYESLDKTKKFHCIYAKSDSIEAKSIGLMKGICANSKRSKLDKLFNKLKKQSNKMKCNAFSVDSTMFLDKDSLVVYISVYRFTEAEIEANYDSYPRNMVYIFGAIRKEKKKGKKFKLNDRKLRIYPLEYIALQNEIDKEISVSVGGFLGTKVWIKGKVNRMPTYLSFTGFNVDSGNNNAWNGGGAGINFSAGKINYVDIDFGAFLSKVLREKKVSEI